MRNLNILLYISLQKKIRKLKLKNVNLSNKYFFVILKLKLSTIKNFNLVSNTSIN